MAKGGQKYDFSFKRTDGTDVGLMLDEVNGKKRYERFTDPALAQQFFTGEASYAAMEPEKELVLIGSSHLAGFGQEFYNSANKKRYFTSIGADARFEDNVICGPKATAISIPNSGIIRAFAEFNDDLYFASNDVLYKLNSTGDGLTEVKDFTGNNNITDLTPFADGNLYISMGSTVEKYWNMNTSEGFTQSGLGDGYAKYMANVAGTMYKAVLPREIKKTTDPTNAGTWSTVTSVGMDANDITELIADIDVAYIGKEDVPYYLDTSDNDLPLIEDARPLLASTNCKNMIAWHTKVYVPLGQHALAEYDGGTVTWRSPALFMTNLNAFVGRVEALAKDEEYLFAIVRGGIVSFPYTFPFTFSGSTIEILAGKPTVVDGSTIWAWHPIQEITLNGCETAFTSSVYEKRLWIAPALAGEDLYYIPLPTRYGDITSDPQYRFQTGGYLVTPWLHANLRADNKAYFKMTISSEGCDANNYITVEYQTYYTALTGTWTNLGNFTTSPSQTRYFPTAGVTGEMIRFRFTIVTNSTSTTPKMTNFDCRGIWRPVKRNLIAMVVKLGDEIPNKDGSKLGEDYTSMRDAIVESKNKVWPNTFYDIDSWDEQGNQTTKYCNLLYAREFDVVMTKGQRNPKSKYELMWEEITLS